MALDHKSDGKISVQEFFELVENNPENRYEYVDGHIYMMTGGKRRHAVLGSNLCRILGNLLSNNPCVVFNSDACVQLSETRYVCPDVTVSCDPRDSDPLNENDNDTDEQNMVRYPSLVVEVLSPGTQSRDRGLKFNLYKDCPTIQEYLLVETDAPQVQLYRRLANNRWMIYILNLEDTLELTSIGVSLTVAEIYKKTRFARPVEE